MSEQIDNGLTDVVGGGIPYNPNATALSQVESIFNNNRNFFISNMRNPLSQAYCEHGLIQTAVDCPVDDAFRGGIDIKSEQLGADDIMVLQKKVHDEGLMETVAQTNKWNRLFGGAGLIVMTNQDHKEPLKIDQASLKGMEFKAVDMWELFCDSQYATDETRKLLLADERKDITYRYYDIDLNSSRVIHMKGVEAPSFVRPRLRGWGLSIVESLIQSINQYFKAKNLAYEVLDEFKLDIFKIKGFNSLLATKEGTQKVIERTALANQQKNFQNALTMDIEDDHISKQLNFSGIGEVMKEIRMQIAADMRIPMSKLFGISASGFSSGEDDIEIYNSMIESQIRFKSRKVIMKCLKLICIREFGFCPDDLEFDYKPLRILSTEQEETVKTNKLNRVIQAQSAGLCQSKEAKEAINHENLLGVKVDAEVDSLETDEEV